MIHNRKSLIQDDYVEKYLAEKELNLTARGNQMKKGDIVTLHFSINYGEILQYLALEETLKNRALC